MHRRRIGEEISRSFVDADPLALVRESRLRLSHEKGNDPKRVIAELRKEETKYAPQIEQYRLRHARVAEGE